MSVSRERLWFERTANDIAVERGFQFAARTLGVVVALAIVLEPMADNGSIVKMDQHGRPPFRMPLRTDLAMKNAERRGSM